MLCSEDHNFRDNTTFLRSLTQMHNAQLIYPYSQENKTVS